LHIREFVDVAINVTVTVLLHVLHGTVLFPAAVSNSKIVYTQRSSSATGLLHFRSVPSYLNPELYERFQNVSTRSVSLMSGHRIPICSSDVGAIVYSSEGLSIGIQNTIRYTITLA